MIHAQCTTSGTHNDDITSSNNRQQVIISNGVRSIRIRRAAIQLDFLLNALFTIPNTLYTPATLIPSSFTSQSTFQVSEFQYLQFSRIRIYIRFIY